MSKFFSEPVIWLAVDEGQVLPPDGDAIRAGFAEMPKASQTSKSVARLIGGHPGSQPHTSLTRGAAQPATQAVPKGALSGPRRVPQRVPQAYHKEEPFEPLPPGFFKGLSEKKRVTPESPADSQKTETEKKP